MTPPNPSDAMADRLIEEVPSLRAFARSLARDHVLADDLVQETILKAWSNLDSFEPGTNMRAWLFTILRNTFISLKRKRKREVEDADGTYAASVMDLPRQDAAMDLANFREAFERLSDDQRAAITLVGAAGFTYDEAAEICDCAPGTIKSRVNRARKALAEILGLDVNDMSSTDKVSLSVAATAAKAS